MKHFVAAGTFLLLAMIVHAWRAQPIAKPPRPFLHLQTLELTREWKYANYQAVNIGGVGHLNVDGTIHLHKGVTQKQFLKALAAYISVSSRRSCELTVEEQ